MDESNSKINRRLQRPRPYDLRRKVLLKNFFEQLTNPPPPPPALPNESEVAKEAEYLQAEVQSKEASTDGNDKEQETVKSDSSVPLSSMAAFDENVNESNNNEVFSKHAEANSSPTHNPPVSNFRRLSSLVRLSRAKMRRKNSICKAKHSKALKSPIKEKASKRIFKSLFAKKFSKDEKAPGTNNNASKSVFKLFKFGNNEEKEKKKTAETSAVNQSVQTDLSWSVDKMDEAEHTNMLLMEENRFLSESLSFYMANSDGYARSSDRDSIFQSPYENSISEKSTWFSFCEKETPEPKVLAPSETSANPIQKSYKASRVTRSKSVQESLKYKRPERCHRTRSLHSKRDGVQQPYFHTAISESRIYSWKSNSCLDKTKKAAVLRSLPVNNPGKSLKRHASMPERTGAKKLRSCRRSDSVRDGSTYVHKLSAQAFY